MLFVMGLTTGTLVMLLARRRSEAIRLRVEGHKLAQAVPCREARRDPVLPARGGEA